MQWELVPGEDAAVESTEGSPPPASALLGAEGGDAVPQKEP